MKFGLFFANSGAFARPDLFEALVTGAEESGFESPWPGEHVVVRVGSRSRHPYGRSERMPGPESVPISNPPALDAEGLRRGLGEFAERVIAAV